MYNHTPENYKCPFCAIAKGTLNENILTKQADIIYKDTFITAFISAGWWPNNKGHVIIIPNDHYENIYELQSELSHKIHDFAKEVAIAFKKVYECDGVSTRQHNEPSGDQDVWHYHLHVFPRYKNDRLYLTERTYSQPEERIPYAVKLRSYLGQE